MELFRRKKIENDDLDYLKPVIQSLKVLGIYLSTSILIADEQKHIVFLNEQFEQNFGYRLSDLKDSHTDILNSSLQPTAFYQKLNETVDSSKVFVDYINTRSKTGEIVRSRLKIIPHQIDETKQKYFLCLYDVIENEISFKDDVSDSYKILMELVEQSPDIICIKDGQGKWLMANEADLILFHLEGVDYKGKTDADLAFETHEIYKDAFLKCMETDEECWNDAFLHRGDEIIPLPEGGEVVLDVLKIPVFNEDKSRKNLIILGRDVSKRREAEEGLIAAKIKAEESDKLKSEFLATMSHELRTPLNSVIGFSDLIESDEDVEEIHDFTRIINNNARSLLNLIEDLFDISLIESEQMKIELAEMDMITTIKEVYEIFPLEIHKLDKFDIKFSLDIHVEHFVITSDSYRIKQVVTNLVRNALKFTEEGQISISFDYDDREVRVVVSDTGIGMEDDKLQTIFERFRQIEDGASRQYGGAGLGLAISKKIALLLGGDIMVSSQKGVGSKFILSLPRSL